MLELLVEGALIVRCVVDEFGGASNPFRPDELVASSTQLHGLLAKGLHPLDTCRR